MKNFEKAKANGRKVLQMHPRMDIHASELRALMEHYKGHNVLDIITDMWLVGLDAGYRAGLADGSKADQN